MFKIINKEQDYAVMNGITKKSRIYLPNGREGQIRPYTVIDALTLGDNKLGSKTFVLLEHEELGEEDMSIAVLPSNGKLIMMMREDHSKWGDTDNMVAYFLNSSRIVVQNCYNGFDDLGDAGWKIYDNETNDYLPDVHFWTEEEINDR